MVELNQAGLNSTYAALADPSRRAILSRLRGGAARVTEIAEPFDMSLNAVSKHIRVLERAGLVRREISGRDHFLSVNVEPLIEASTWIEEQKTFWEGRLDALESFLQRKKRKTQNQKAPRGRAGK
ncbi:MAG: winged helix-turn-helix transcriptional regulator [Acidobacteria bacterium]|nr:winged helix-turn-helix transcriptional regulator [Acidobacteriota bacterium]